MNEAGEHTLSGQIPFGQELARKDTHLVALVIPGGYYLLDLNRYEMLSIMIPITILMILIDISRLRGWPMWDKLVGRLFSRMIRVHEHSGDFTGATYILTAVCATIALFDRPVAVAALAFVIVGDSLAAVIGRRFGQHRFRNKSIEGSLGCLAGTAVVALAVPELALAVGLLGAVTATIVEAIPIGIDDNVTMPLTSGLVMTLSLNIINYL